MELKHISARLKRLAAEVEAIEGTQGTLEVVGMARTADMRQDIEDGLDNVDPDEMRKPNLASWQSDYEAATGKHGKVTNVFGRVGRFGGLAIWVEVEEDDGDDGKTVYYSPYLDQSPSDEDLESFNEDEDDWISMMEGATDWSTWDWGAGEEEIPEH